MSDFSFFTCNNIIICQITHNRWGSIILMFSVYSDSITFKASMSRYLFLPICLYYSWVKDTLYRPLYQLIFWNLILVGDISIIMHGHISISFGRIHSMIAVHFCFVLFFFNKRSIPTTSIFCVFKHFVFLTWNKNRLTRTDFASREENSLENNNLLAILLKTNKIQKISGIISKKINKCFSC